MSEEYILMDNKEASDFIGTFLSIFQGRYGLRKSLANFAIKEGFGEEIIFIFFKADLGDYDQTQIPKMLDDKHVLLEYDSDVDEIKYAYLDFPTFYEYLAKEITEIVKAHRKDSDLLGFLAEIRTNLIVNLQDEVVPQLHWYNSGFRYMGDRHIVENHAEAFAADGIPQEEIESLVKAAVGPEGQLVSYPELGGGLHRVYGVIYQGRQHFVAVAVAKNGDIISASPSAHTPEDDPYEIRLMLDYDRYPAWLYDSKGNLITANLPIELKQNKVLSSKLAALQDQYDALFIDTEDGFKCNGFESKYDEAVFLDAFYDIQKELEATSEYLITNKITGNYVIKNEISLIRKNEVAEVKAASIAKGWYVVTIQGKDIKNEHALFDILGQKFKMPDNGNWNAVADWMTDLGWLGTPGVAVIIEDYPSLRANKDANEAVIEMFAEDVLPFWERDVIKITVGGERRPFNVYLVE
ncbi:barstar family protein [Lactiplantibacillus herbarum]|uniref:barstar family protein n=1 Tax=Lactiplantibacillus herbarum TaxID=1670446 RepID=UPI000B0429B5|nr:barstar family protein [Lactiplantibacillus herbarum]